MQRPSVTVPFAVEEVLVQCQQAFTTVPVCTALGNVHSCWASTEMSRGLEEENQELRAQLEALTEQLQQQRTESTQQSRQLQQTIEALQLRAQSERELYEELMQMQDSEIAELSTPLLPVAERVLVMPLIGKIDEVRAARILHVLLAGIAKERAQFVILDVSGITRLHAVNTKVLLQATTAGQLLGAQIMVSGMTAEHAHTILGLGIDMSALRTQSGLRASIEYALAAASKGKY